MSLALARHSETEELSARATAVPSNTKELVGKYPWCTCSIRSHQASLASHPYFSLWCICMGERGSGKGRKNTSGNMCQAFVPSARVFADPIKFQHSK